MDSMLGNFSTPIDHTIKNYLEGEPKYRKGIKDGPKPEDSTIKNISKEEMKSLNNLKNESPKLTQKKGKLIKFNTNVSWKSVNVTPKEATKFENSLWTGGQRGELGQFLLMNVRPRDNKMLENGKTLYGAEAQAIYLYSGINYLLINGTLDNDSTSLKQWVDYQSIIKREEVKVVISPTEELKKGKSYVNEIAKLAASGINKLPPFMGQLYRGDAMSSEKLDEWRNGKIMMTTKFFSCSSDVGVGEQFARQNAVDYMKDKGEEYKPVLYVFNSQSAKDIREYSENPQEDERVYTPGQAFRSVGVDETIVPGLAIIYMEEITL